jgi:Ssp1 endopeptidase immunity protein Rap1a
MKYLLPALVVIALSVTGLNAQMAQGLVTGADWVKACQEPQPGKGSTDALVIARSSFCLGYLTGVFMTNGMAKQINGKQLMCIPAAITVDDARKIFLKFMKDHPEKQQEPGPGLVLASLALAFPCPR